MNLPLHPMVVHLPIALTLMLPFVALGLLWRGRTCGPRPTWWPAVAAFAVLAISASVAVSTGERDEDLVEPWVPETALEAHEQAADVFLVLAWVAVGVAAVGLVPGVTGRVARYGATGLSGLLLIAALRVGHAGGELVYRYGAAQAHVTSAGSIGSTKLFSGAEAEHVDEDDD